METMSLQTARQSSTSHLSVEPGKLLAQAVILAGAHPWAERILESAVYRPLVPIASRPLICHALDWLRSGGIRTASICANGDTVLLRRRLQNGTGVGVELDYYEDVMPRGPAGCARDVAAGSPADVFLVLEGSILPNLDIDHLLNTHATSGAVLTVVVTTARRARSDGRRALEPAGMYVFSRQAFQHIPASGYQDIKETLIPKLYTAGQRVETYLVDHLAVPSVTGLPSYLAISERAVERLVSEPASDREYVRMGEARVHVSARIAESARLIGPALIERGCTLEGGALVVGPATIGTGSTLAAGAVVTRSVLWSRCCVEADAVVDHCIMTDSARVAAGKHLCSAVIVPEATENVVERWLSAWWPPRRRPEQARARRRLTPSDRETERIGPRPGRKDRSRPLREGVIGLRRLDSAPASEVDR